MLKFIIWLCCIYGAIVALQGQPQDGGTLDDLINSVFPNTSDSTGPRPSPNPPPRPPPGPPPTQRPPPGPPPTQRPAPSRSENVCVFAD